MSLIRLSLENIEELHTELFGNELGFRERGREHLERILVDSKKYNSSETLAAFLASYIVVDQPFKDGNKRTSSAVLFTILYLNGVNVVSNMEKKHFLTGTLKVYGLVKRALFNTEVDYGEGELTRWIQHNIRPPNQLDMYRTWDKLIKHLKYLGVNRTRILNNQRGYRAYKDLGKWAFDG